jgi:hypothetical protein
VRGLLVLMVLGLVGCQFPFAHSPMPSPTATLAPDDWTALRQRPLHLPSLAAGTTCPIDHWHQVTPNYGPALGDGPAYAAIAGDGVLIYAPPANFGSVAWGGNKVLWFVRPEEHGPILVRGQQLDGHNEVRFEFGDVPPPELAFRAEGLNPGGWTGQPSYTRVRATGCYAYQVDARDFTEVIVFQARPA